MSVVSDFLDRLVEEKLPEFIAPVTPATRKIVTKYKGVPYTYSRDIPLKAGWYKFTPHKHKVSDQREPETWEIDSYLELYKPRWALIALYRLSGQSWLCYPFNESDASQKGWSAGPIVVHLISESVEPFDRIMAHGPLYNLIYRPASVINNTNRNEYLQVASGWLGNLNQYPDHTTVEYARSIAIIQSHLNETRLAEAEKERRQALASTEGKLKYYLAFLGAELLSWHDSGADLVVRWKDHGQEYSSRVSGNMSVTSAGICLSGRDKQFNVAALVDVMREARELNRPGAHGPDNDYDDDD